jgi:pimeloyl-ACP methyl ester carboxylesterase
MTRQSFYPFKSERSKAEYQAYYQERARAWPVACETMFLDTPSGTTLVRASGRVTDPPLVLLPGARAISLMWSDSIAALSARHRVYVLDILGDAGLSVSRRATLKADDLARWLDEVFAVLVPEGPLSLMGISYGGLLAGQYAVRFPGRLRNVVLAAPGGFVLPFSFAFFVRIALLCMPVPGLGEGPFRRTLHWLFRDAARGDAACRARLEETITDLQMVWRHFDLPAPDWPTTLDDKGWQDFAVPCLFLVGENEKIYSAKAAVARLHRVAPQVKTEIIPGAGHDLILAQPALVARKVLEFLDKREVVPEPAGPNLGTRT